MNDANDVIEKLYFEPSSACNLSCEMCFRHSWIDEKPGLMPLDVFKRALFDKGAATAKTLFFGGMGEPLMHPDIIEMVSLAAGTGARVELITNSTLLSEDMITGLLEAGLSEIWVSIDGFADISTKGHAAFTKVVESLQNFGKLRRRLQKECDIGLTYVVMKSNVADMRSIPSFARFIGARDVNISNMIPGSPELFGETLYAKTLDSQVGRGDRWGELPRISLPYIELETPEAKDSFLHLLTSECFLNFSGQDIRRKSRYCRFVSEGNAFVRSDGDVSPCMALLHSNVTYLDGDTRSVYHHSFGNVADESLYDIWHSKEYSEFRARVRDFSFSPCVQCSGCEFRRENKTDCFNNPEPTCGACLWSEGIIACP